MPKQVKVIPATINPITHMPTFEVRKKRVAAYARVSTGSEEQATSYKAQCKYYTDYIKSKPDWEYVDTYSDEAISGLNIKKREGFQRMVKDALDGKIDLIITKSVSRFARNTVDSLVTIRQLKDKNIEVYFEEQNIYTLDSKGELLLTIMASIAQEESRNISQNVQWGHQKSMEAGHVHVAYKTFLGYYKDNETGKIMIDKDQAETVRLIYGEFMKGKTSSGICKELMERGILTPAGKKEWRKGTVDSILKNEKYKGEAILQKYYTEDFLSKKVVKNNGERKKYNVENSHPAIISKEEWDMVQAEMLRRKNLGAKYSSSDIFSSKLECGCCGGFFGAKIWHSTDKYRRVIFQCNKKYAGGLKCDNVHLDEESIKASFIKAFNKLITNKDQVIEDCLSMVAIVADTTDLDKRLSDLDLERELIAKKAEELINENKTSAQSQEEYVEKYNVLDEAYKKKAAEIEKLQQEKLIKEDKRKAIIAFADKLKKMEGIIDEWDDDIWCYMVEKAIVFKDGTIKFIFKNGCQISI